jgi:hypothetical protein
MANDLVVQLGARLDQFERDMDQAGQIADASVSRIEESFSKLNPGFNLAGLVRAGGVIGATTAGVIALVAALSKANEEMADIAKNAEFLGVSVERFQELKFAATAGGVGGDDATKDLRRMADLLADAKQNENSLTKLLEENNIKYKDRNGEVLKLNQMLQIAANLLGKFDSMPEKVKAAQMLGLSEKWVEALKGGGKAFNDLAAQAEQAGAVIDRSTIAKAERFDAEWKKSSAIFAAQFKAALLDVAGFFDDLIDKAGKWLEEYNKSQGVDKGQNKERFDALADSLAIASKDALGLAQDVDQLTRVIDRMRAKGGDLGIIAGLEEARQKAIELRQELARTTLAAGMAEFPGGPGTVPFPRARPAEADKGTGGAKLPTRGTEGDEYTRALETIEKHTERLKADTEAVGLGAGALEAYRAEHALLIAAKHAGITVTEEERKKIMEHAEAARQAGQALAQARVMSEAAFAARTAFLTPEDVQIAQQLRQLYGNDVPAAMASSEAAALRLAQTMKRLSDFAQDLNRGLFLDFTQAIRNGASAWDAFQKAGLNALGKIADKLAQMAAEQLWKGALGPLLGSFSFSSGSSAVGNPTTIGSLYAEGTPYAQGGWAVVGEKGPELMNIPRGTQIMPNDVASKYLGSDTGSIVYSPAIDARGASVEAVARLAQILEEDRAAFQSRVVATIQQARRGRWPGV